MCAEVLRDSKRNDGRPFRGQALVEFALALPILLLVVYGLLEVGRMIFMYAAVTTASREAARFASAYGRDDAGNLSYQDCEAIRNSARKVGFLLNLQDSDILIQYDHGPGGTGATIPDCDQASGPQTNINPGPCDRVIVTVNAKFVPIVPIVPLTFQDISITSARSFLGLVDLNNPASQANCLVPPSP